MTRRSAPGVSALLLMYLSAFPAAAGEPLAGEPVKASCRFDPADDDKCSVPDRYRLPARTFDYQLAPRFEMRHCGVTVYDLSFPSPVKSTVPENDTVRAEYFMPRGAAPASRVPGVLILDILDGAAVVSRGEAVWLAQNGVASLFVYMAHYGPRRPPGSRVRLVSPNVELSMAAVRQTVLDCRCAAAWLAARPEVDPDRLGVVGTSLGSLIGANVAAAEPRLKNVCLLLPAGGLVDAFYDHPKAKPYLPLVELMGGKDGLKKIIAPADPLTYAPQLRQKNLLLIAASRDDVLPPKAATALWEATGKQKILWFDSTHVGAAAFALPALKAVAEHVKGQ
ncbi:MAG: Alpha/beta hydrolase family protein [Gemmataceae bacterium]|nr:Alpha/beta hydrolase family protein [Gemmataceae bacterium]